MSNERREFTQMNEAFAEEGIDLDEYVALERELDELERDIVIGLDAREFLGNVEHFNDVLRYAGHAATSLSMCNYAGKALRTYLLLL